MARLSHLLSNGEYIAFQRDIDNTFAGCKTITPEELFSWAKTSGPFYQWFWPRFEAKADAKLEGKIAYSLSPFYAPCFLEWSPAELVPCWFADKLGAFTQRNKTDRVSYETCHQVGCMLYLDYLQQWEELRGVKVDDLLAARSSGDRLPKSRFARYEVSTL
jgi:hypothetical protein